MTPMLQETKLGVEIVAVLKNNPFGIFGVRIVRVEI